MISCKQLFARGIDFSIMIPRKVPFISASMALIKRIISFLALVKVYNGELVTFLDKELVPTYSGVVPDDDC